MQVKSQVQIISDILFDNLGYQYDSRDGELFLKSGYNYTIYTITPDRELIPTVLDLREETKDAI